MRLRASARIGWCSAADSVVAHTHFVNLSVEETERLVGKALPLTRSVLSTECWWALIRDFCALYYCCEPELHKVAEEVLDYLDGEHRGGKTGFPGFLCDLVHCEWLRLALPAIALDPAPTVAADGDLLEGVPVLAQRLWLSSYDYPVHSISAAYAPIRRLASPQRWLAYCNDEGSLHWLKMDEFGVRVLEGLEAEPALAGRAQVTAAAQQMGLSPADGLQLGLALLAQLRSVGAVRGTLQVLPAKPAAPLFSRLFRSFR